MKTEPAEALNIKRANIVDKYLPAGDEQRYYDRLKMHEELIDLINSHSPKIKQLEWVDVWEGYEDAKTPFGHYVVRPSIDNKTFLMIDLRKGIQPYLTLNEAKAAAQADFEKRVKECLE